MTVLGVVVLAWLAFLSGGCALSLTISAFNGLLPPRGYVDHPGRQSADDLGDF